MKTILIFGQEPSITPTWMLVGDKECDVGYVSARKLEVDPASVYSQRPNLIVNITEPSEGLAFHQGVMTFDDGKVVNLY